jgi:hypothetical protein
MMENGLQDGFMHGEWEQMASSIRGGIKARTLCSRFQRRIESRDIA